MELIISIILIACLLVYFLLKKIKLNNKDISLGTNKSSPVSVNYHFSRKCNYECGFCFHTAKTSHVLSIEQSKLGLLKLKNAGMKKINFAGGEPFLYPNFLGELV